MACQQMALVVGLLFLSVPTKSQEDNSAGVRYLQCDCMEFWQCHIRGGKMYSYCAYSSQPCCFLESNSKAVGILPKRGKLTTCGKKGLNDNQDGVALPGEWPWHAAILEKPQDLYVCGGSLVDEFWILTAAHCVDDYKTARFLKVRLGEHDVATLNEPLRHEEYDVDAIILHPDFDNETLVHDIALVKLLSPVRRRPNINNVCLPDNEAAEKDMLYSRRCFVTGWGKRNESSSHSVVLKEINVPIWDHRRCEDALQDQFGSDYELPPSSLCAGAEGRDACDGDGGGPLVCEKNNNWYQVGVVSFGIGCGRPNIPGVYTRVQHHRTWIHDTVLNS